MLRFLTLIGSFVLLISIAVVTNANGQPLEGKVRADCIKLKQRAVVTFEGDSITYGQDESSSGVPTQINGASQTRSRSPFPETFETALNGRVRIVNRGFPGDRLRDKAGDLNFIQFGGNDALNNGHMPGGIVSVSVFEQELSRYVQSARFSGSRVVLLNEPPFVGDLNIKVEPYREAVRRVGSKLNLKVIETTAFLRSDPSPWTDGVHLKASNYLAIGEGLAALICGKPNEPF